MARSSDTRARILRAAAEHFQAKGYQHTSLEAIAASAGVTKATVLYHFASKDQLVAEMLEPLVADLEQITEAAATQPPHRRAWALVEGWLDFLLRNRSALGVFTEYARVGRPADVDRLATVYFRVMGIYFRAFEIVSGPRAGLRERVRASQVLALVSDPVMHNPDVDPDLLREVILDGVRKFLDPLPDASPGRSARSTRSGRAGRTARAGQAGDSGEALGGGGSAGRDGADRDGEPGPSGGPGRGAEPVHAGEAGRSGTAVPSGPAAVTFDVSGRARRPGRPVTMTPEQVQAAAELHRAGSLTVDEIAARFGVSRSTLYRHLRQAGAGRSADL